MNTPALLLAILIALTVPSFAEKETPAPIPPVPLDSLVAAPEIGSTAADFGKHWPDAGFRWLSEKKDAVHTMRPGLTLGKLPVLEATARFRDGKLSELVLMLFNRGDAGTIKRDDFEKLLDESVKTISELVKAEPEDLGKNAKSAVNAEGMAWRTPGASYTLESSVTREVKSRRIPFRAEFIRLTIAAPSTESGLFANPLAPSSIGRQSLVGILAGKARVTRRDSGDVILDGVPMVDQGPKGYCVVASVGRVMRYFGVATDQHEMAQIANSSADQGTSGEAMMDALKKLASRLRVRVRIQYDMELREFLDLIRDYNRAAKKAREPEIDLGNNRIIDVAALYGQMNSDVLRAARTAQKSDYGKFQRELKSQIDSGIPLLWSVALGLVPEPEIPQVSGGHMRLIIGYNPKTDEIIFTDSWGRGHEEKRMAMADAWSISKGLHTIEPI